MLNPRDFAGFVREVHDRDPFPWQQDLTERILAEGRWPDLVDVPTALGKTSMLDIAVFVMAADHRDGSDRVGRRRVFFVVDRRLVVNEAYVEAEHLAAVLARPGADRPITRAVGVALRALRSPARIGHHRADPVVVTRMRGGTTWATDWVDRPDQPAIVVGTVDQVGSRLLFRGYGTSDERKPIDAALVGTDSVVLVDEAHLAQPMVETANAAFAMEPPAVPLPHTSFVLLSATAGASRSERPYAIDVAANEDNPIARQRLHAPKGMRLATVPPLSRAKMPAVVKAVAKQLTEQVTAEMTRRPGAKGLVVCNTTTLAREVHRLLGQQAVLLMGRSRPFDRETVTREVLAHFGAARERGSTDTPSILVSTQAIEVGANIDVDVLVTESAPLDSLVQRFGRLNRFGISALDPCAIVVHLARNKPDPIYEWSADRAWQYLQQAVAHCGSDSLDVGPLAVAALLADAPSDAYATRPQTPVLLREVLDTWTKTGPVPCPDVPVAQYLHGYKSRTAAVDVCWRSDLTGPPGLWGARLDVCPPVTAETINLPYRAFRRWGMTDDADDADLAPSDLDETPSANPAPKKDNRRDDLPRVVVERRGRWTAASWFDVRPGDTVAIPCGFGGADQYGWDPSSNIPVQDVHDVCGNPGARRTLRIDHCLPDRLGRVDDHELAAAVRTVLDAPVHDEDGSPAEDMAVVELIDLLDATTPPDHRYRGVLDALVASGDARISVRVDKEQVVLHARTETDTTTVPELSDDTSSGSSLSLRRVGLAQHHEAVSRIARGVAEALGLPENLVNLVEQAAAWHDLGKLEPRFQAMLHGGSFTRSEVGEHLAKSGMHPYGRQARAAAKASRKPPGWRHEAWSAVLVKSVLVEPLTTQLGWRSAEVELVTHLVASHHGHSRAMLPPVPDEHPTQIICTADDLRVTTGVKPELDGLCVTTSVKPELGIDRNAPARFRRLNQTYGRWGLALLEAIVRTADHTCSRHGS